MVLLPQQFNGAGEKGHIRQDEQDQLDILFISENNNPENLVNPV